MKFTVEYKKGVSIRRFREDIMFLADPITTNVAKQANSVFITHAHTDHSIAFPNKDIKVFSTKLTKNLYEALTKKTANNSNLIIYNSKTKINDIEVEFVPAGHVLGAAQIIFYFDDATICYTGDISTDEMLTVPKARTLENKDIDILIIEATYGSNNLFFEARNEIKLKIIRWIMKTIQTNKIPIVNIGVLGPAQEITAFLNDMLSIDVYCGNKIARINEVYNKNNVKINWKNYNLHELDTKQIVNSVIFLHRGEKRVPSFLPKTKIQRAIVTGQSSRFPYYKFNQAFAFSMHSTSQELIQFTKLAKPKKVYTLYGYDSDLAAIIRKNLGIPARPLKHAKNRQDLLDFV